ncbi:sensor histidine kinase [Rhodococcus opacus]|uniref:sensor histidine kinase n=1 Tax=Rhodococcus opacus TaxID=37919 RepID=UPI0022367706|nr:ATP-binding protein [Rhodococcus opacus]UZG60485.1 ATP-binding protein [Rhodococcus opacus]
MPPVTLTGAAGRDLVHILAELFDNALHFSPPDSGVTTRWARTIDGGLVLDIIDHGIGISPHDLDELNHRIASTPQVTPDTARHMGLFVVSELATRHHISVTLRPTLDRTRNAGHRHRATGALSGTSRPDHRSCCAAHLGGLGSTSRTSGRASGRLLPDHPPRGLGEPDQTQPRRTQRGRELPPVPNASDRAATQRRQLPRTVRAAPQCIPCRVVSLYQLEMGVCAPQGTPQPRGNPKACCPVVSPKTLRRCSLQQPPAHSTPPPALRSPERSAAIATVRLEYANAPAASGIRCDLRPLLRVITGPSVRGATKARLTARHR